MKKFIYFLVTICLSFFTQVVFAADLITYTTERGSVLELGINEDHSITGFFTVNLTTKFCPEMTGLRKPITGNSESNTVNFIVSYPECHADLIFAGKLLANNVLKITSIRKHDTALFSENIL